jgi:tRNA threonylcarbamoyladenosine biosynthesis protein TsaE
MTITTNSEKQTFNLGQKMAEKLQPGVVIGLIGELGAGKTILIKGLAKGLGINQTIASPTFVLMKVYKTRINADICADKRRLKKPIQWLCHVDAYRLKSGQDLIEIGLKDWLNQPSTVTVIEWADQVKDILPKNTIFVKIKLGKKKNQRIIMQR